MDNRLTFYKINSPYKEDNTKPGGLLDSDIDSNFMSLKEYDIKEGYLIKGDTPETQEHTFLILKRVGNEIDNTISIDLTSLIPEIPDPTVIDLDGYVKDLTFEYDQNKGLIIIKHNDSEQIISGLSTIWNNQAVFSNETIDGNGIKSNPLKISPVYLTGTYAPCISLIDETISGTSLPTSGINYGDRYLTKEKFYKEGYYYNAQQMEEINTYLSSNNSGWRIPTKADWDNILNAAETCEANRNHTTTEINDKNIGFISGKRLKSVEGWSAITINNNLSGNTLLIDTNGTDDFGFTVLPAGQGILYNEIADDYGGAAYFWTSAKQSPTEAYYTKEFYTNEATTIQGINQKNGYNSIRLVRDINNGDVSPVEEIDGHLYPTVTMPSLIENKISDGSGGTITEWTSGSSVWTQTNLCGKFNLLADPIQPLNSGETVYFVNYWNGNKWQRNELKEGFTVILHNGFDNTKVNEYRVVNGELINTNEIVYDKVIERLSGTTFSDIYAKISANTEDINEIKVSLSDKYSSITSAISVINEISSGLISDINSVSGKLDTFSGQTITFESNITSALSQEITARQDEGQILSGEINRAKTAENAISASTLNSINNTNTKIDNVNSSLTKSINSETDRAKTAENAITNQVTNNYNSALTKTQIETDNRILDVKRVEDLALNAISVETEQRKAVILTEVSDRNTAISESESRSAALVLNETDRAKDVENSISASTLNSINNTNTKIDNVNSSLTQSLNNEILRATSAEQTLDDKIKENKVTVFDSKTINFTTVTTSNGTSLSGDVSIADIPSSNILRIGESGLYANPANLQYNPLTNELTFIDENGKETKCSLVGTQVVSSSTYIEGSRVLRLKFGNGSSIDIPLNGLIEEWITANSDTIALTKTYDSVQGKDILTATAKISSSSSNALTTSSNGLYVNNGASNFIYQDGSSNGITIQSAITDLNTRLDSTNNTLSQDANKLSELSGKSITSITKNDSDTIELTITGDNNTKNIVATAKIALGETNAVKNKNGLYVSNRADKLFIDDGTLTIQNKLNNVDDQIENSFQTISAVSDDLETKIDNVNTYLTQSINSEIDRAKTAEIALSGAIHSETDRAKNVENSLSASTLNSINNTNTKIDNVNTSLTKSINSETDRAKTAENAITNQVTNNYNSALTKTQIETDNRILDVKRVEDLALNAISVETEQRKAAILTEVSYRNTAISESESRSAALVLNETNRAETAENAISASTLNIINSINNTNAEIDNVNTYLTQSTNSETDRAKTAEIALSRAIHSETDRAKNVENAISASTLNIINSINNTNTEIDNVNTYLTKSINSETDRAKTAEIALSGAIRSETNRAKNVENSLSASTLNIINSFNNINTKIDNVNSSLTKSINSETDRAATAELTLDNKINENKVAIDGIELSTIKNKGIFTSVSSLETTVPSPNVGDWAGVGTAFPVKLYVCNTAGTWVDSGSTWNGGDINLSNYVTNTTFSGLVGTTNNIISEVGISDYEEYNPYITYETGAIRTYQGKLYKCISDIISPEQFNNSNWAETSVNEIITNSLSKKLDSSKINVLSEDEYTALTTKEEGKIYFIYS